MDYSTGKLFFIVLLAVLLACAGAWVVAWRYRRAMRRLMSAPLAGAAPPVRVAADGPADGAPSPPANPGGPPRPVTLAHNRRAGLRLTLLLIGLSALMALSEAALQLRYALGAPLLTPARLATVALVDLWPVLPAIALLWRWRVPRFLGALLLWVLLCFGVLLWRSIEPRPLEVLLYLAAQLVIPLLLLGCLFVGAAARASAPWLLVPLIGLVWASIAGIDVLALLIERRDPLLLPLTDWIGARETMLLFALLPWLLAWWPLRSLGRALGRAYASRRVSELTALFAAAWAISLIAEALSAASSMGVASVVMLLPMLWIPLGIALARRVPRPPGRPPTLLVLRVFQRDAQVQALFDDVIDRWRLTGNTVLIAGTDLADRTLDADDVFTFLDGGLAQRFIRRPEDVGPRLDAFELAPDAEGRFRVNECYCHDSTWRDALAALVRRSDVVLMDLRGFQSRNAGCLHELAVLARAAPALARVVVLTDAQTDRAAADGAAAGAPAGRFVWLEAGRLDPRKRREVLASLFVAGAG